MCVCVLLCNLCVVRMYPTRLAVEFDACSDALASTCSAAAKSGIMACFSCAKPLVSSGTCEQKAAEMWCYEHGGHHSSGCGYDQEAGAVCDCHVGDGLCSKAHCEVEYYCLMSVFVKFIHPSSLVGRILFMVCKDFSTSDLANFNIF